MTKPRVYAHLDYVDFLKTRLSWQQARQSSFSLRSWARDIKLSPAYLSYILNRQRPLTLPVAKRMAAQQEMSNEEKSYFLLLVRYQNESDPRIKEDLFKQLSSSRNSLSLRPRDVVLNKYLSNPLNVFLREAVLLKDFRWSMDWLKKRFWIPFSVKDFSKAKKFLVDYDFLSPKNREGFAQLDYQLDCSADALRSSMARFHREMLKYASDSIYKVPRNRRNIQSHTACVSPHQFARIRDILQEALEKIQKITREEGEKTELYYISLQLIPLMNEIRESKEGETE